MSEERLNEEMVNEEVHEMSIDELSEEEVKELRAILERFIQKYKENPDRETTEWLREQLQEELPDRSTAEIEEMATEIVESVKEYDEDLKDLNENCNKGMTKASWFAEKVQDSAKGMAVNQFGNSLFQIEREFEYANLQMERTILRSDGEVSQCINLDGFIAEQYHVNNFNAKAIMENSPYRARVCVPDGEGYARNSVDVMIDNIKTNQRGVMRYQFKFGKDSQSTISMLERGDYSNQRIVVPKNQVEAVQNAYPNKSVTDCIGGTEDIKIKSDSITKEQVKKMQAEVQKGNRYPEVNWNSYEPKELAMGIGKRAGKAGVQAALLGMGVGIAYKAFKGEKIEADEVVETALTTGADAGVKCAASGALTVAVRKGALKIIPPGTPVGTIAKIASVGIENVKILWKVAKGELTMKEALEHMGRTSTAMYAGMTAGAVGAGVGAVAFSWIPIVGPVLGGVVGGMAGYMAGSKFGEVVFNGARKIYNKGKELVKKGVEKIKDVGRRVANKIRDWLPW